MSLLSVIRGVGTKAINDIEALVPGDMKAELGVVAHALVSNIKYDFEKSKADVSALAQSDIAAIWAAVKETAATFIANPAIAAAVIAGAEVAVSPNAQTVSNFEQALVASTKVLQSTAATVLIPALKHVQTDTLNTMSHIAASMVTSGVVAVSQAAANTVPASK